MKLLTVTHREGIISPVAHAVDASWGSQQLMTLPRSAIATDPADKSSERLREKARCMGRAKTNRRGTRTAAHKRHNYKREAFEADRPGRCPLCTREYQAGELVKWAHRMSHGASDYLPAHTLCVEWEHKAR